MRELTTQTGIVVKCSKTAIEFFQNAQSVDFFSVLEIPEEFRRLGLIGSSEDWERLARGVIQEFEENNSGVDLFHFDSDEDVFCVYSQYIDDLMLLSKMIRAACDNEKTMGMYLNMSEVAKA